MSLRRPREPERRIARTRNPASADCGGFGPPVRVPARLEGRRTDATASKNRQLACNFASRGGRSTTRARAGRPAARAIPGTGAESRGHSESRDPWTRHGSARAVESRRPRRTPRPTLLDTPRPRDMLTCRKRNGISVGCEPDSTSLPSQVRGFRPHRFSALRESPGKAGAPAMGLSEAVSHGAFGDVPGRPPTRLLPAERSLKRARSFPRCTERVFHPPIGGCGMRIAEPLGEMPARHGNRQTEEMA
jgi:hypothetical protein